MKRKASIHKNGTAQIQGAHQNTFEQLGFDKLEAAALERKSALYTEVVSLAQKRDLTQRELASLLGVSQPHVSQLLGGKISRFSIEKLIEFAERLGANVKILVRKKAS